MATPEQWGKIKEIVGAALEQSPADRGPFIDHACSGDWELRAEVESLLAAHADAGGLSAQPWAASTVAGAAGQNKAIGPYRLIQTLGVGGMGQVWLAEQTEPVRRRVALKLIRPGMYDEALVKRFQSERQSLAIMEHPAIAKVFDAGATAEGQPYFAMEYVDGLPITEYCDRKKLGIRERLKLFMQVCEGVQHAHQKAIIHRDLKPSNILVAEVDGKPVPRIIDFGLAKTTVPHALGETLYTHVGAFLGTPGYMSPEQADPSVHDVDTRTDVYSLGVVLYELLTGSLPFDITHWKNQNLDQVLRQVRETDPQRPSTKVRANRDTSTARAEARSTEAGQLVNLLRGDLDSITLKALEKERDRRYATPSALAADVENYLRNRPVEARPASAAYRVRKFLGRNKLAVASATAVLVALVVGLGMAIWEARIARSQAKTAEAAQAFLKDIFRANSIDQADPAKGRQTTAAELLDIGAKKVDGALEDAPDAKLRVLETLGQMYDELELNEQAANIDRKRVHLAKQYHGNTDPSVAQALVRLAVALRTSPAVEERQRALTEATSILDHNRDFSSQTRARLLLELANQSMDKDLSKTLQLTEQAVKINEAYPPDRDAVSALISEGVFYMIRGDPGLAEPSFYRALKDLDAIRPPTNHDRSQIYTYLGQAQRELQKFDAAEKSQRLAYQVAQAIGGPDHQLTLIAQMDLGWFLFDTGRSTEGLALMGGAKERILKTRGSDPQTVPYALNRDGRALLQIGRLEEGQQVLTDAVQNLRKYRPGSGYLATVLDLQAAGLTELGRYQEARAMLDEASQIHESIHDEPIYVNENLVARSRLLLATGKTSEAAKVLDGFFVKDAAPGLISTTWARGSLARADADLAAQEPYRAIDMASKVRAAVEKSPSRVYFKNYEAQAALVEGKGLLRMHRSADALPLLRRAVELSSDLYDRDRSPILADAQIALALCLVDLGETSQAHTLLAHAKTICGNHIQLGEHIRRPVHELEQRLSQKD